MVDATRRTRLAAERTYLALMERALVEGHFVPFDGRALLVSTVAVIVLGVATLLAIVI